MTEEKDLTLQGEIQRLKETINIQAKDYIELKQEYKQAHEDFICSDTALRIANNELDELKQENNAYKQSEQEAIEIIAELKQENKELKSERDKAVIAYNNFILDIVSDIPFKGEIGGEREISIKDHLHQMQKALASLEEIIEIADKCKECLNEDDDCGCDYLRIKRKIDEVLEEIRGLASPHRTQCSQIINIINECIGE